jgi:integrase
MNRSLHRLTTVAINKLKPGKFYHDGGGLYLQVRAATKSWLFRFMIDGKPRGMGLGSFPAVSLAEARRRAAACREKVRQGIDPLVERERERVARRLNAASAISFKAAAERYIEAHKPGWKNAKHGSQWSATLATYAFPIIGELPIAAVETPHVLKILEPIWSTKTETASRVRMRLEAIIDSATARGERAGDNPARWKGHLAKLLPQRSKVSRVEHFAALPYAEMPGFFAELRSRESVSARALAFAILTAARSGELRGATWGEIDLVEGVWTIPGQRMKAGREHRVPLTPAAVELLGKPGNPEFPLFARGGESLSDGALRVFLQRDLGREGLTAHGFRSTFRDWAAECTAHPSDVVEMALAHVIKDRTEAAYRRGDLFEKRRQLMNDWALYCTSAHAKKSS